MTAALVTDADKAQTFANSLVFGSNNQLDVTSTVGANYKTYYDAFEPTMGDVSAQTAALAMITANSGISVYQTDQDGILRKVTVEVGKDQNSGDTTYTIKLCPK